jgi:hypothetical protein
MPKHDKVCIIENNMENILYGETNKHFESVVHQLHISIFSRSFEEIETKL